MKITIKVNENTSDTELIRILKLLRNEGFDEVEVEI